MYNLSKLAAGTVLATTAALGGTSTVLADGYAAPRVAYERPADWSGVYFGLSSGWQWNQFHGDFPVPNTHFDVSQNSGLVGAHLGIQHQFGAIVLGVEGGWNSAFKEEPGVTGSGGCHNPCSVNLDDILTVGARVGWSAGRWMPYVTGGYASGAFSYSESTPGATPTVVASSYARISGWYLGGGAEWAVSPGWSAGVEYRFYDFGDANKAAFTPSGVQLGPPYLHFDPDNVQSVMARVSWRWGRPDAAPLK
jgi:opacity protein-like surface antigen